MSDNVAVSDLKADMSRMSATIESIADNVKKLTEFMVEHSAQSRANEEKFSRTHHRINDLEERVRDLEHSLMTLSTDVIPSIKSDAAVKGAFWRMVGAVSIPVMGCLWSVIWAMNKFADNSARDIALIKEAAQTLVKLSN